MTFDQAVAVCIRLEMIFGFHERQAGLLGKHFGDPPAELRVRVDAGPDGRPAHRQFEKRDDRSLRPFDRQFHLSRKSAEFLTQPQRRRVGQVRATDLDDLVPGLRFRSKHVAQSLQGRYQFAGDGDGDGDVDRRRKRIVRALAHVDVVVRMDRLLQSETVAAKRLDRPVGDDLVDVHVARRARTGLKDVDWKLISQGAVGDLPRRRQQRFDLRFAERMFAASAEFPQIAVDHRTGVLDQPHCADQFRRQRPAGNRKVLDGPLGLRPVISIGRHMDVAHRVVFDSKFAHRVSQSQNRCSLAGFLSIIPFRGVA